MRSRLAWGFIIASLIGGGIMAQSGYFVDHEEFPRSPLGPATLGGALTLFERESGTAPNTLRLSDRLSSTFLQNTNCTVPGQVWKRIDTNGRAICGNRGELLAIATFCQRLDPSVRVLVGGRAPMIIPNLGYTLRNGDIIQTGEGQATVCFNGDSSILRLDTRTTVELDTREISGGNIAQAILADGRLWGRILTSTGVNIGGGTVTAGVRGTSVSLERGGQNYTLTIPHSQRNHDAAVLTIAGGVNPMTMPVRRSVTYNATTSTLGALSPITSLIDLYRTNRWIRDNTILDLGYMSGLPSTPYIQREIQVTIPGPQAERRNICSSTSNIWYSGEFGCVTGYANNTTSTRFWLGSTEYRIRSSTQVTVRQPSGVGLPSTMGDITPTRMWDDGRLRTLANDGMSSDGYTYWSLSNILSRLGMPRGVSNCQRSPHYRGGRDFCIVVNQWLDTGWSHLYIRNPASATRGSSIAGFWSGQYDDWRDYRYEQKILARRIENPVNQTLYTEQAYNRSSYGSIPNDVTYIRHSIGDISLPFAVDSRYKFVEIDGNMTTLHGRTVHITLSGTPQNGSVIADFGTQRYTIGTGGVPRSRDITLTIPTNATRMIIGNSSANGYISPINTTINSIVVR